MSDEAQKTFGEQLIRSQIYSPSAAERYRSEMETFLERRFTPGHRWIGFAMAAMYLAFAVAPLLVRDKWQAVPLFRGIVLPMSIAFLMLSVACVWTAVRGKYNRKSQSYLMVLLAVIGLGFGGMAMLEHGWTASDPIAQRRLIFCGAMMLLFLGGTILVTYIEDLHRKTEERLIRLEYRLAELSEKLDRQSTGTGG
jgi:hypothetical protein